MYWVVKYKCTLTLPNCKLYFHNFWLIPATINLPVKRNNLRSFIVLRRFHLILLDYTTVYMWFFFLRQLKYCVKDRGKMTITALESFGLSATTALTLASTPTLLLASIVWRLNNAILQTNHYPMNKCHWNLLIFPVDSAIDPLNNNGTNCTFYHILRLGSLWSVLTRGKWYSPNFDSAFVIDSTPLTTSFVRTESSSLPRINI